MTEPWQKDEWVAEHLEALVTSTVWSGRLSGFMFDKGVISPRDQQLINSKKLDNGRVAEFYRRLFQAGPTVVMPVVIEGLLKTGQIEAAKILEKGVIPQEEGTTSTSVSVGWTPYAPEEEGATHPCLENEVILNVIFKHIVKQPDHADVVRDIQSSRQVSHAWRSSATHLFRKHRAPMSFTTWPAPQSQDLRLGEFLSVMEHSLMIPVQKYRLCADLLFHGRNRQLLLDFLRICGPEVEFIELEFPAYSTSPLQMGMNLEQLPSDLHLSLSELTLHFKFTHDGRNGRLVSNYATQIGPLMEIMLGAASSLRNFEFSLIDLSFGGQASVPLQSMEMCIFRSVPTTVKSLTLKLHMNVAETSFQHLMRNGVKLKQFETYGHPTLASETFHQFLESQADSLKLLRILPCVIIGAEPTFPEFPRMNQLLHLELNEMKFNRMCFRETFPKVYDLDVSQWREEDSFLAFLNWSSPRKFRAGASNLTKVRLPNLFPMAPLIRKVCHCFPNIVELHISSCPDIAETLEQVFLHLWNVERLFVKFPRPIENDERPLGYNLDGLLAGVPERIQRLWNRVPSYNLDMAKWQQKPSLLNMTKLRKLVLNYESPLTDFTVHHVFLEMGNLEVLDLNGGWSRHREISPYYIKLLEKKLALKI